MSISPDPILLQQAWNDVYEQYIEITFLIKSQLQRIRDARKEMLKKKQYMLESIVQTDLQCFSKLEDLYNHVYSEIHSLENIQKTRVLNIGDIHEKQEKIDQIFLELRSISLHLASTITTSDWQSPSYRTSLQSQAGRQTGHIFATYNDYKRDQHIDEKSYQRAFVHTYIDTFFKHNIHAFATNSGMAAFTTIIHFLQQYSLISGQILVGQNTYFEAKEILSYMFPNQIIFIDEHDTENIINVIRTDKPVAIFLDSLCNSSSVAMPDLPKILSSLNSISHDMTCIIDNTGLASSLQPLSFLRGRNSHIKLIVYESLNKYHQYGMDRVTGGIIWARGKGTENLFYAREHTGTNITDINVNALPLPNKRILEQRRERHQRNTLHLAKELQNFISKYPRGPFAEIIYPGLLNHPAYNWATHTSFAGSCFTIRFQKKYQKNTLYKHFLRSILQEAQKQNCDIVWGTSFGLNTTRIYIAGSLTTQTETFIRVAVGSENYLDIEAIKAIFIKVMTRWCTNPLLTFGQLMLS